MFPVTSDKTAATGWHRGSGHRACGQRAVPPESNAVPIRNRPLSPPSSGPFGPVSCCAYQSVFLSVCASFSLSFYPFSPRWRPSPPRRGTGLPPSTCTVVPNSRQTCGSPARGGRGGASVLRWCGWGRSLGGRALPQTRRIATAAMAAITSNSVRSGRFIGSDSSGSLGVGFGHQASGSGTGSSISND